MALADDLLFEETERPTMAEFNERLGTIGGKLDTAAFLNALKTVIVDSEGNELLSIPGVQIETGSYTGTGTYGSSNPNSLTFGFEPKFVLVAWNEYGLNPNLNGWASSFIAFPGQKYAMQNNDHIVINFAGGNLSWYSPQSAFVQCNNSNYVYTYIAIG